MRLFRAAIGGAAATTILWYILNAWTLGAAARIVRELGWPVSSYWLASAVGAVLGMMARARDTQAKLQYSARTATVAEVAGLAYLPTVEPPPVALPCFENWHSGKDGNSGELDGVPVSVFDMTERIDTGEGISFPTRTIVLLPADGLPPFTSSPRWAKRFAHIFGLGGMTFNPARAPIDEADTVRQFVRTVRIDLPGDPGPWTLATPKSRSAEEAVRRLITPTVMATLLGQPGWSFQAAAGWLACWRGQEVWPADERMHGIATASAVRAALLAAAADPSPVVVPPARLPTGGQFMARGLGTILGLFFGLFGTFFLSFFGLAEVFGRTYPVVVATLPFLATAVGVVVFGLLGYGIGAAVGWIPALARWTPLPEATPEQKAEKARRESWQRGCGCLGFFAGGPVGFAVFVALDLFIGSGNRASGLRSGLFPILSIGGAIAGLIGGIALGSWVARRRPDTLTAKRAATEEPPQLGQARSNSLPDCPVTTSHNRMV